MRGWKIQSRAYVHHVKAKGLASYRLEHVIDEGLLEEGSVHRLYVRKIAHQFETNTQKPREGHVFYQDWELGGGWSLAYSDAENDLRINLRGCLARSQVRNIIWSE